MRKLLVRLATPVALAIAIVSADVAVPANPAAAEGVTVEAAADGTARGAIEWFRAHRGDTGYEGYCEMAAENAYGTTGVWESAIAHWNGAIEAGKAHRGDRNPPLGAFVYWNTSVWGHVGVADGEGGVYSTSVGGAIGRIDNLGYFTEYLGWSDSQVPQNLNRTGTVRRQH